MFTKIYEKDTTKIISSIFVGLNFYRDGSKFESHVPMSDLKLGKYLKSTL